MFEVYRARPGTELSDTRNTLHFRVCSCPSNSVGILLASGAIRRKGRRRALFNDWLPFAIYGLFALAIPATMLVGSFKFATRPHKRVR